MSRPPAPPPDLPGYTVSRVLGSGGFADVYRYEQHLPRRSVAVKVLIPGAADHELLAQFDAEANLMAALSTHPAIVTIHQAGISREGRPYLVMEFCSRPNLSARYRAERLSVAEVLRIGVLLAGAVETAHRAGILHRDIKPANVLTTDFGHPVLSDFGISVQSSTHARAQPGGSVGMSIPWTAPEIFAEQPGGDERADIYALAATLYTVLARRSPYERPGGPNGSADLISRIRSAPLPALGRSDVPPSLERVLGRAMDKNRGARNTTALDLAHALQQVEAELRLAPTPIDVLDEDPAADQIGDSPATRVRALTVIEPEPTPGPVSIDNGPLDETGPRFGPPGVPRSGSAPDEQTLLRRTGPAGPGRPDGPANHPASRPRRSPVPVVVGGGLLLAVVAAVAVLIGSRGSDTGPAPTAIGGNVITRPTEAAVQDPPSRVTALTGRIVGGKAEFSWRNPDPQPGDYFLWHRTDVTTGPRAAAHKTRASTVTVVKASEGPCIGVKVVRDNGMSSDLDTACAGNPRSADSRTSN
jgi:serine/threonine protein kinase